MAIKFLLILILFTNLFSCFHKEKKDNRNLFLISGLLYLNSQKQAGDFNCATAPSPTNFAEFKVIVDSLNTSKLKCSECHDTNNALGNLIFTNYSSVIERVNAGNPNTSILYSTVKSGGSMNVYSNPKINQAIYCWIGNWANP